MIIASRAASRMARTRPVTFHAGRGWSSGGMIRYSWACSHETKAGLPLPVAGSCQSLPFSKKCGIGMMRQPAAASFPIFDPLL
jgi:hypothetical protein